jgi:hypothetical protein
MYQPPSNHIPLRQVISIPSHITKLSPAFLVGDRSLLEQIVFEPGSRLSFLDARVFFQCGPHSAEIRERVEASQDKLPGTDESAEFFPILLRRFVNPFLHSSIILRSLCIPASVEQIGEECFAYATSVSQVKFEPGSRLRILHQRAFFASLIESIDIPPMVSVLPERCFAFCVLLSSVKFAPDSQLRAIGAFAFSYSGLESIHIPRLVDRIGESCFNTCTRLSNLTFAADSQVRRLDRLAFAWCIALPYVCIPSSVELIGRGCFWGNDELTSVTFDVGSKLSDIEWGAFYYCGRLGPSIQLPSSLTAIPNDCFRNCSSLSVIAFGRNPRLRTIGDCAFEGSSVQSFCFPGSVVAIDWSCFPAYGEPGEFTFESPACVREILHFTPRKVVEFAMPDSVEVVTVSTGSDRPGFICSFGMNSRLRDLRACHSALTGFGFMRLSEASLKRIRSATEWTAA